MVCWTAHVSCRQTVPFSAWLLVSTTVAGRRQTLGSISRVTRRRSAVTRSCCPACLPCPPATLTTSTMMTIISWMGSRRSSSTGIRTAGNYNAAGVNRPTEDVATTRTQSEHIAPVVRLSSGFVHQRKPCELRWHATGIRSENMYANSDQDFIML